MFSPFVPKALQVAHEGRSHGSTILKFIDHEHQRRADWALKQKFHQLCKSCKVDR